MIKLPTDANANPIQAVGLLDGGAHSISTSATSARNTQDFNAQTKIISLFATEDVYIRMGDQNVHASSADHFFPKETYYDLALNGATHIAALQVSTGGTLYISEKA